MSLSAVASSVHGTLRQEIEIDGKHRISTDEPKRLGGDDTGPSPHELIPAALAACIATHMAMYARTKGWDLGGVAVSVDYDHRSTPRRFDVDIRVGAELSLDQWARLHAVAVACPVRKALGGGAEFTERLRTALPEEHAA